VTAKIIPFPIREQRECFRCTHGYAGDAGVICEITRDFVFDERATAADCEYYERGDADGAA
jgi:hypothetical protein